MALEIGDKVPDFTVKIEGEKDLKFSDYKGKWVILYFYPKDNTPGCTKEACSFRDNMDKLTELGAEVIGVSTDSVASHEKFISKQNLNFHLISDADKTIAELFGAWREKSMFGKKYMGIVRSTYIIDHEGVVRHIYPKVKVSGHTEEVMNKLKELQN